MNPELITISMAEYLRIKALSASLCNALLSQSPAHAFHELNTDDDDPSAASETGTAIHDLLLEGRDRLVIIDAKDYRTAAAKEQRDFARSQGSIPILKDKAPQIEGAVKAAKAFVKASELDGIFKKGHAELTALWNDPVDGGGLGVSCKARPDWLPEGPQFDRFIVHVKTTAGSAEPNSWIRNQLFGMGYDVAAVFYERAFAETERRSIFLVIEQSPPHGCAWIGLSPAAHELASSKVARAIDTWGLCAKAGKWPGYPHSICYAEPFAWQMKDEQQVEINQAYDALQAEKGLQP